MVNSKSLNYIDEIYNEYNSVRNSLIADTQSSASGQLLISLIQQVTLSLFTVAVLAEKGLVRDSSNHKINQNQLFNLFLQSKKIEQHLRTICKVFDSNNTKRIIKIEQSCLEIFFPSNLDLALVRFDEKEILNFKLDWKAIVLFVRKITKIYAEKVVDVFSTIFEHDLSFLNWITEKKDTEEFSKIDKLLTDRRRKGVYYTPIEITLFINQSALFSYLSSQLDIEIKTISDFTNIKDEKFLEKILNLLENVRILDPTCGSGDFLLSAGLQLYELKELIMGKLSLKFKPFEIKKDIINKNLYGVDLIKESISIAKLRLFFWSIADKQITNQQALNKFNTNLFSGNSLIGASFGDYNDSIKANQSKLNEIILTRLNNYLKSEKISENDLLNTNPFHWSLNYDNILQNKGFDIIIGNPPYIEMKKLRNKIEKKMYSIIYDSAYKLYDISILFIERGLELLKEGGILSYIITNKFISSDFGYRIRQILLDKTKIEYLIDVSYISVFKRTATYPIIMQVSKSKNTQRNLENKTRITPRLDKLNQLKSIHKKSKEIKQEILNNFPQKIFPLTEDFDLIYSLNQNPDIIRLGDLGKFHYRILGFIDWNKHLKQITNKKMVSEDLPFIGTANISKYLINPNEVITLAKKRMQSTFLNYNEIYEDAWQIFKKPKLSIKEISKELTVAYDSGLFSNLTGVYMFCPYNISNLKILLIILNSKLLQRYFAAFYGSTHLAGGYLRFNGSYLKQLPIILPKKMKLWDNLANYLIILQYLLINEESKTKEIREYFVLFSNVAEQLVNKLYSGLEKTDNIFNLLDEQIIDLQLEDYRLIIEHRNIRLFDKKSLTKYLQIIEKSYNNLRNLDFI